MHFRLHGTEFFSEVNNRPAAEKTVSLFWNQKVYYFLHMKLPLDPVLYQLKILHIHAKFIRDPFWYHPPNYICILSDLVPSGLPTSRLEIRSTSTARFIFPECHPDNRRWRAAHEWILNWQISQRQLFEDLCEFLPRRQGYEPKVDKLHSVVIAITCTNSGDIKSPN